MWLKPKAEPVLVAATRQTCSAHLGSLGEGPWQLCGGISWKEENPHSRNYLVLGAEAGAPSQWGKGLNRLREGGASCGPLFLLLLGLSLLFEVRGPRDLGRSLGKRPTVTSSVFWTLHTNILNTKPAQAFVLIHL